MIERAAARFEEVRVVVLNNPLKQYVFALKERVRLIKEVVSSWKNVKVDGHQGLLADYAYSQHVSLILRGIRNPQDLTYERMLQAGNREQWGALETFFMLPHKSQFISSSFVKSILKDYGNIAAFVPLKIKQALEERVLKQIRLGVTGSIACGKSSVARALVAVLAKRGISATYVDLDKLVHRIYRFSQRPDHLGLKAVLLDLLGPGCFKANGDLHRSELSRRVYQNRDKKLLNRLTTLLKNPLELELRKSIAGKVGLILIDGTVLLEHGGQVLTNNNFLFVSAAREVQAQWLMERDGVSYEAALNKIELAGPTEDKMALQEDFARRTGHGRQIVFHNNQDLEGANLA